MLYSLCDAFKASARSWSISAVISGCMQYISYHSAIMRVSYVCMCVYNCIIYCLEKQIKQLCDAKPDCKIYDYGHNLMLLSIVRVSSLCMYVYNSTTDYHGCAFCNIQVHASRQAPTPKIMNCAQ